VLSDEGIAPIALGKRLTRVEPKAQRRRVCAQRIIRFNRSLYETEAFAFMSGIYTLTEIRVRSAVERALPDVHQVIGNEFIT
jgi:hypothetical protein